MYAVVLANPVIQEVGERKTGEEQGKASDVLSGAFMCRVWRHGKKGAHGIKTPLPVILLRRGCPHTRRLDTTLHGALRSREASPSQRSSLQGLLPHGSSNLKALHFTPTADMHICLAAASHGMQDLVDVHFPQATVISVVLANLNPHTPAALYATFPPAEACRILRKLDFHYTPTHGSWLNMAEIEFAVVPS